MKNNLDKEQSHSIFSEIMQGAVDFGKKVATDAKTGVATMREKLQAAEYARLLKKYNPLFPEQYQSDSFHLPNIIVVVDDAVRKEIDVCEGAIGWLSKEAGEEVLHLYDEAVPFSGIQLVPAPICNAVYYIDHFDRNCFIQVDCIFSRTLKEKIDELQHIAESIGAKRCSINISEDSKTSKVQEATATAEFSYDEPVVQANAKYKASNKKSQSQYGRIEAEFTGLRFPKRPVLRWFAYDTSINNLIETCCSGKRRVKKLTLELSGSTSSTMSQSIASAIDGVLCKTLNAKGNLSMKSQAQAEFQSKLLFQIEF